MSFDPFRGRLSRWVAWGLVLTLTTLGLLAFRQRLDKAHVALLYLLVVLAGTAGAGRAVGLTLAGIAFLLFDTLFLPPYGTLVVADPLDWLVLVAFLLVSGVVAQILHRLQQEATQAREHAELVARLAALGAETSNVARADQALTKILENIKATLGVETCRVHLPGPSPAEPEHGADSLVRWVAEQGRPAARLADGTTRLTVGSELPAESIADARAWFVPLSVRGRTVGVLELAHAGSIDLDPPRRDYLAALAYYAALAVERGRLEGDALQVEAFREADRLKDALLASVSHDLRTPLTTIKALAHDLSAVDERAFVIEEEADRLNLLVGNLLDLSRLKAGALPLTLELNAVDDLLGALAQRIEGAFHGRPLAIRLDDGGTLLLGRFDFAHSLRILSNLVENAHKYSPPGAPIEITARRVAADLELEVADRGPGISAADLDRIFEPFYRSPGTAPDTGGAGLGLAIARQLAVAQHGTLRFAPRAGGGSVFTLTLPAADAPPPSAL